MSEPVNEPNFEERRQYKRIEKHFILTYYDSTTTDKKFLASQLKNISRGGMCLVTDIPFPKGTILAIDIKSPFFANVTHMQGEVLDSHECVKDIIYETRLRFKDLSAEAEDVIQKSVKFFQTKENGYA